MGASSSTPRNAGILRPPPSYVPETYSPPAPPPPTPPEAETEPRIAPPPPPPPTAPPPTAAAAPPAPPPPPLPPPPPHSIAPLPGGGGETERVAPAFPSEHEDFDESAAAGSPPPPPPPPLPSPEYGHEERVEEGEEGESAKRLHDAALDNVGAEEGPPRKRRTREGQEVGVEQEEVVFAALTADAPGGVNSGADGAADEVPSGSAGAGISARVDAVSGTVVEDDPGTTDFGAAAAAAAAAVAAAAVANAAIVLPSDDPSSFAPSMDIASPVAPPALDPSSYDESFGAGFATGAVTAVTMGGTVTVSGADLSTPAVAAAATVATAVAPIPTNAQIEEASTVMYSTMTSMPDVSGLPSPTAGLDIASPPLDAPAAGGDSHTPLAIPSIGIAAAALLPPPPPPPLSIAAGDGISPQLGGHDSASPPGCPDGTPQPPEPQLASAGQMAFSLPISMSMSMLMPSMPLPPGSIAEEAPQCETAAPAGMVPPAPYPSFLPLPTHQLFHVNPVVSSSSSSSSSSTAVLSTNVAVGVAAPSAGAAADGSFGSTYADAALPAMPGMPAMPAMPAMSTISAMPAMSAAASFMLPQPDSLAMGGGGMENALATQPLLSAFLAGVGVGAGGGAGGSGDASGGVPPAGSPPTVAAGGGGGVPTKARVRRKKPVSASGDTPRKNRNRPSCATEGCKRRPLFGMEGTRQAQFCARHKEPQMVNVLCRRCEVEGCKHQPSFGAPGSRPVRCAGHKLEGMVNVSAPRCQHVGCQVCPSFGRHGDKRASFCAAHRREGDVDLVTRRCHHEGCVRRPVFGHAPERKVYYCARHKLAGMVNVFAARCEYPDCTHQPSWGLPGAKRPTHCAKHRTLTHENKRGQ